MGTSHPDATPPDVRRVLRPSPWVLGILLVHAGLLAWGAGRHSFTLDEIGHFGAGVSHWRFGRFELYRVNPPLVRMVAALPVLASDVRTEWGSYSTERWYRAEIVVGRDLIAVNGARSFWLLTLARWACIPFSLLGGWVCYLWARKLYGERSGLLALVLWCSCPNILGHGQLITPDVGAAALGAAASFLFWRWLLQPTWSRAASAGVVLGLAELSKLIWVLLFVLWPILWAVWCLADRRGWSWRRLAGEGLQLIVILLIGLYAINLGYLFNDSFRPLGEYRFTSEALGGPQSSDEANDRGGNRFAGTWLARCPVPLPADYVLGIDLQKWDFERRLWSYLRGEWRLGGWWYYYLYALAIKVPIGTLLCLALAAVASLLTRGNHASWRDELVLVIPGAAVLIMVSAETGFNHHLRYVLPAFPFGFIWASKTLRPGGGRVLASLAVAAAAWGVASSLGIYPHNLSYFNEFVGGPANGYRHLAHSNTDWGQDILDLKRWLDAHPEVGRIGLAHDVPLFEPRVAGIDYDVPPVGPEAENPTPQGVRPGLGPQPGWYAISVNKIVDRTKDYAYFERFRPVARIGYTLLIYHITPEEVSAVRTSR